MADITQGRDQFRLPDRTVGKQFKVSHCILSFRTRLVLIVAKFKLPDRTSTKSSTGGQTKEREVYLWIPPPHCHRSLTAI